VTFEVANLCDLNATPHTDRRTSDRRTTWDGITAPW